MDPGARSTFSYSSTDRYQGILIRVEDVHEGDIAAEVTSPDGEPLVFLVQPDGTPVPTGVESEAEGGHARLEAHDLAPGKYFLVTRERSNKAATFTVAMVDPEDPPGGSGAVVDAGVGSGSDVDAGVGSGSGSGSGSGMPPAANCPNLPALQPLPAIAIAQVPTAPAQQSDTEGNVITDGMGHNLVTYTSLNFASVFTGETVAIACSDDGHCDDATLARFPYQGVGDGYTCDPVLARDATTGRAFLAWINVTPRGSSEIAIATSDDMGQSWQNAHVVASAKVNLLDKPWIAAANGRVLVSYGDFDAGWGPSTIRVVESKDGGRTFADPVAISAAGSSSNLAQLALSADGAEAYISWFQDYTIMASHAAASSTMFAAPAKVDTGGAQVMFDPPGNALGSDGRFWIGFVRPSTTSTEIAVVSGRANAAGGIDFQPAVAVQDAATKGCSNAMHPAVTTDEMGTPRVAFYDNRTGTGNVWVTSSTDGNTWTPNTTFTPSGLRYVPERGTSAFLGDYIGIVAAAGRVSAVFAQDSVEAADAPAHFYFATSK
jgi:hypothetical protein